MDEDEDEDEFQDGFRVLQKLSAYRTFIHSSGLAGSN